MATIKAHVPASFNDEGVRYLELYMGFIISVYLLHTYLDFRQLKALRRPDPPAALAASFSRELYDKTRSYSLDKWWFSFFHSLYSTAETLLLMACRFLPAAWAASGALLARAAAAAAPLAARAGCVRAGAWLAAAAGGGSGGSFEIAQTVVFVFLLYLGNLFIELPWGMYGTFVIEQRHGFNKQTLGLYLSDMVKQVLLAAIFMPPVIAGVTYILQVSGPLLPLYMWAFILALSLFLMTIYPTVIAPLFNKYEPLPEGPLRTAIEALAASLSFPLRKLYRVDGSRRSGHSNAYMYGFFANKRIVLYDTLISQASQEQVVAVLAHELGHWKLRHTPLLFTMNQAVVLLQFCLFTLVRHSAALPASFGFSAAAAGAAAPAFVCLVLFQFIVSPLDEVIHFASNVVSRSFEFAADGFAVAQGHGPQLRSALLRMEEENRGAMHTDAWFSAYHYSHPPLVDRLAAIDAKVVARGKKAE